VTALARGTSALVRLILVPALLIANSSWLRADGGVMRLCERTGGYQVSVFTAPTPFRAGPVDVSVFVQDAATGECVTQARVTVRLQAHGAGRLLEFPATSEAATNKLFRAAEFRLPDPGWWDVAVSVEGPHGPALVRFDVQADEPLPRWLDLWPWFGWPALAVALFGVHHALVRRRLLLPSHRALVSEKGFAQVQDRKPSA
jgi:hypothetical protein